MGTPAQIGKPKYKALIVDGRLTVDSLVRKLERALQAARSQEATALIGGSALELAKLQRLLTELDEFGKTLEESRRQAITSK